ncbi:MAG: tetratricopeptide repeat protein, partial [Thermodesulfobacteriota bacterium]|nr:tetratricopeptide repeat protein [Thermodesulfobacteriota bacterium]
ISSVMRRARDAFFSCASLALFHVFDRLFERRQCLGDVLFTRQMAILYFFDAESRASQKGLLSLDELSREYEGADLIIWGITLASKEKAADFVAQTKPDFPVLLDTAGVSDLYQARVVLPTVCILGPGLKVLDHFQGGGKTTEVMLVRLAGRQLQRRQILFAKALSETVVKKNPKSVKARTVKGHAALKEGNLDEAGKIFKALSKEEGEGEVLGKEGLAAVHAKKGDTDKALKLAKEVEKKAPNRPYAHVIKGDLLYAQGQKKEAEVEYRKAVQKEEGEPYQQGVGHNQLGRLYASAGEYDKARDLYDEALEIDPYYIEATSNKGVTYEKEGKWDEALGAYRQALTMDKSDTFAAVLAKKAEEMLAFQKDVERKKRMDTLVKDLAERYRKQKKPSWPWSKEKDTWTSRPMVLSFVDFQEKGGLAEREGLSTVLNLQLTEQLNASGRVKVVERVLIEQLLEELNLGSSDLANSETALKLGQVLAARIMGTGSLFHMPEGTLLTLRLIDTETSAIPKVVTRQLGAQPALEKESYRLNREILKTVIQEYPLRGHVVETTEQEVMINLGSEQGVVLGTRFQVVEEQEPVKYEGKLLKRTPKPVAEVEVVRIEPDLCYARVASQERPLERDDKVQEKLEEAVEGQGSAG